MERIVDIIIKFDKGCANKDLDDVLFGLFKEKTEDIFVWCGPM